MTAPQSLGFRRRCGWCAVQLRGWQLNLCRRCKAASSDAGIYLQGGGPPCGHGSRFDAYPDARPPWVGRLVWLTTLEWIR